MRPETGTDARFRRAAYYHIILSKFAGLKADDEICARHSIDTAQILVFAG